MLGTGAENCGIFEKILSEKALTIPLSETVRYRGRKGKKISLVQRRDV
jgi:hypothetical protein